MSPISDSPRPDPLHPPHPENARGDLRRVGVEVEFSGVTEREVARVLTEALGGEVRDGGDEDHWIAAGTELGDFECYLDSRPLQKLDHDGLGRQLRELARTVVPVEIVSEPIEFTQIGRLDDAVDALREAGATGTRAGVLLGFGVHFNPEVISEALEDVLPTLTAYALLEDHLRRVAEIDISRRLLPWVDSYPRALVDQLAGESPPATMTELINLYLDLAPSRNHGLDMLCFFAHVDRARVARSMEMEQISARPTYHLRLPDCRIDEPDWCLAAEWNRWVLVERVAADADLLDRLKTGWREHRASLTTTRSDWSWRSARILQESGL
ncbi:amidoligase family protein [Salipiger mucosus]|uniref:Amidoligase enzyme n=1 Tax=Salipiger mucosus DSM 16094 TaxID=1123237 RepID=S9SFL9_9RHOB|nr:amidoligase family protein [Salipiger mucosus]EPX85059.1 hypothetical protein Salmuc_00657 [Salipiger mucosus DSM 16094]